LRAAQRDKEGMLKTTESRAALSAKAITLLNKIQQSDRNARLALDASRAFEEIRRKGMILEKFQL
jgi:hypothetical protein